MIQYLVPASYCGDSFVGVGDPLEGFAVSVVVVEEAVDGGLKLDDASKRCRASAATCGLARLNPNGFVPPPPTLLGPIDRSLVDVLPLKDFRLTSAPEPSTWAMMALGFGGLGFVAFRGDAGVRCDAPNVRAGQS